MPADIKHTIAKAAKKLMKNNNSRKLTVKDIVEECHITRQAFYYHFEDIADLIRWMLQQEIDNILNETLSKPDPEEGLRCFFLMGINAMPYIKQGLNSNYRTELEQLLKELIMRFSLTIIESKKLYMQCSRFELKLIIRYHCSAIYCMLYDWSKEDSNNLDAIVHTVYRLITEGISPA